MKPIIALTTDFGDSSYVGQLKGTLLKLIPDCIIVDNTHAIPPQDIIAGALALADSFPHFPEGTIHIGVVDPGVGTQRRIVAARFQNGFVVGPDNGLLSEIHQVSPLIHAVSLNVETCVPAEPSATFHGRDIMVPAAAKIASGDSLTSLGTLIPALAPSLIAPVRWFNDGLEGQTIAADSFGNLITNVKVSDLRGPVKQVRIVEFDAPVRWVRTYGDAQAGQCVALIGSSGRLEISVVDGSAKELFSRVVTSVVVTW